MEILEPEKFRKKYRIDTARWKHWDYSSDAGYFITICTVNREHFFGEIVDGEMKLNELGKMAERCWMEIPNHFPFATLDQFVVMPNHMHGILFILKPNPVETQNLASLPCRAEQPPKWTPNKFGPQSKNLASIIRGYKIGVTKFAKQNNIHFSWQPRYHDRVIRNEPELERIRKYIFDNPANWESDRNNF